MSACEAESTESASEGTACTYCGASSPFAVRLVNASKVYGDYRALAETTYDVRVGETLGIIGPNGAGKTTTLRLISRLAAATSGHVEVLGHRLPSRCLGLARAMGVLIEEPAFYPGLDARANLGLLLRTSRCKPNGDLIDRALEEVGLQGARRKRFRAYSSGMRQRLGVAAAIMGEPRLVVLDEPGVGLDPDGARELRDTLLRLSQRGCTVVLSSHQLHEVEAACSRVALINRGAIVRYGSVTELLGDREVKLTFDGAASSDVVGLLQKSGIRSAPHGSGDVLVAESELQRALACLAESRRLPTRVEVQRRRLEDIYFAETSETGSAEQ